MIDRRIIVNEFVLLHHAGMWTIAKLRTIQNDLAFLEALSSWLWAQGAQGVETRDGDTFSEFSDSQFDRNESASVVVRGYFPPETDPSRLELPDNLADKVRAIEFEPIDPDGWRDGWRQFFATSRLSERVVVRPSWETDSGSFADSVLLEIDPGMAFGTGTHETTRMCTQILDRELSVDPNIALLDVGSGSGILSIAAKRLGAASVVGIEIDPIAVEVSIENWTKNGLEPPAPFSTSQLSTVVGMFDLVVANMLSHILLSLRSGLLDHLKPEGRLILSGILDSECETFFEKFSGAELQQLKKHTEGEWVALELGRQ